MESYFLPFLGPFEAFFYQAQILSLHKIRTMNSFPIELFHTSIHEVYRTSIKLLENVKNLKFLSIPVSI